MPTAPLQDARERGRLRAAPPVGAHAGRGQLGHDHLAAGVRRARREPHRLADLRGGVLPRRCAAAREPERHLPARARRSWSSAPRRRRRAYLPKMAAGEEIWAQAWSEPQAGSDLAALRATAVRDGDSYVLAATRSGHRGRRSLTGPSASSAPSPRAERHRGLSFMLVPLRHPGVRVRGIRQIHGEPGFAEIFFEDARVPVRSPPGRGGRRLAHRHGDRGFRARPDAAQPGALPGGRAAPGAAVATPRETRPTRRSSARSRRPGWTPRPMR